MRCKKYFFVAILTLFIISLTSCFSAVEPPPSTPVPPTDKLLPTPTKISIPPEVIPGENALPTPTSALVMSDKPSESMDYFNQKIKDLIGMYTERRRPQCWENKIEEPLLHEVGLFIYDLKNNEVLAEIQPDKPFAFASAIKAPIYFYHLDSMDYLDKNFDVEEVDKLWDLDFKADNWDSKRPNIFRELYRMIFNSNNLPVARVLDYVFKKEEAKQYIYQNNPNTRNENNLITQFNDWSRNIVGTSEETGLYKWWVHGYDDNEYPTKKEENPPRSPQNPTGEDTFYVDETANYAPLINDYNRHNDNYHLNCITAGVLNIMSARDLARYYYWIYNKESPDDRVRRRAKELLSKEPSNRNSKTHLQFLAQKFRDEGMTVTSWTKAGGDTGISVEAGIIEITDSTYTDFAFLVVAMVDYRKQSVDEKKEIDDRQASIDKYKELFWGKDLIKGDNEDLDQDRGIIEIIIREASKHSI